LQLQKSGYDVTVVEAQDIPGGRVKTIRKPFANGGYAEAGAVRIYSNHRWTMQSVKQMGLESKLAAYDDETLTKLWYLQGKRFTTPTGEWPLAGLTAQDKANPFAMVGQYWGPGLQSIGNVLDPDYPGPRRVPSICKAWTRTSRSKARAMHGSRSCTRKKPTSAA
jgi:monoamine oxidase